MQDKNYNDIIKVFQKVLCHVVQCLQTRVVFTSLVFAFETICYESRNNKKSHKDLQSRRMKCSSTQAPLFCVNKKVKGKGQVSISVFKIRVSEQYNEKKVLQSSRLEGHEYHDNK